MIRSYFQRVSFLSVCLFSSIVISWQPAQCFERDTYVPVGRLSNRTMHQWSIPSPYWRKEPVPLSYSKLIRDLFFYVNKPWALFKPTATKGDNLKSVTYQAENSIIFDAKNNILSLYGGNKLCNEDMKLEADRIDLYIKQHMLRAVGSETENGLFKGTPIFTHTISEKDKYGRKGSSKSRTFFMERLTYNIDTKRALVDKLLTNQDESIIKSEQVKQEDEATFYAHDLIYTTCAFEHPHFYIRAKRSKMVRDRQITSGPFCFYFDDVPTPLGFVFGTLFLEGKRAHGIIPPEVGEDDSHGFYIRNGGYYVNFNDYVDLSILGALYANGLTNIQNKLRYKKRYYYSGNIDYEHNTEADEYGWALKWTHTTLAHGPRNLNANVQLHNKGYLSFNQEADSSKLRKILDESSASLSYQDKLIGFPYDLTLRIKYDKNVRSNYTHWTLPEGNSNFSWYPFRNYTQLRKMDWLKNISLKHNITFEHHIQNLPLDHNKQMSKELLAITSNRAWNSYTQSGILHDIPVKTTLKLFKYINVTPVFSYSEAWYFQKRTFETNEPTFTPGFYRVHSWDLTGTVHTALYHTNYFRLNKRIEGFRVKMEPSVTFTYTPDFSTKELGYFQEVEDEAGKKEKKYLFSNLRPAKNLADRSKMVFYCKLHNSIELRVKDNSTPDQTKRKPTSKKIYLLKKFDFETKYDFKEEICPFVDGIKIQIANDVTIRRLGELGFDWTTSFNPYLTKIKAEPDDKKQKPIICSNQLAWEHGKYLGSLEKSNLRLFMNFTSNNVQQKKDKKQRSILGYGGSFLPITTENSKEHQIDFENPWKFGWDFTWNYEKKNTSSSSEAVTTKYINFNGSITLIKKWKLHARGTYNFKKEKLDPSTVALSIQRDLHCWQLSYEWYPMSNPAKYDFSLGAKANALKALKLPRKRSYNKKITTP